MLLYLEKENGLEQFYHDYFIARNLKCSIIYYIKDLQTIETAAWNYKRQTADNII